MREKHLATANLNAERNLHFISIIVTLLHSTGLSWAELHTCKEIQFRLKPLSPPTCIMSWSLKSTPRLNGSATLLFHQMEVGGISGRWIVLTDCILVFNEIQISVVCITMLIKKSFSKN